MRIGHKSGIESGSENGVKNPQIRAWEDARKRRRCHNDSELRECRTAITATHAVRRRQCARNYFFPVSFGKVFGPFFDLLANQRTTTRASWDWRSSERSGYSSELGRQAFLLLAASYTRAVFPSTSKRKISVKKKVTVINFCFMYTECRYKL